MDYTPNQYDNDYSRHVKRMNELEAQRQELKAQESRPPLPPHRRHEPFAFLLALATGGGVWLWLELENPRMDFWEHLLLSFGALLVAAWFFTKYRRITRGIGFGAVGLILLWVIVQYVKN
jgi:hypothetical protein